MLVTLLDDESKRAAPYSCLLYVASTQVYIIVSKLALSLGDSQVTVASIRFFNILINGEAEGVLDSKIFARSLVDLVRKTAAGGPQTSAEPTRSGLSEQDEGHLIELLFSVTTKIRLDPDILPAWFYPERDEPERQDVKSPEMAFVGATRKNAFPLFYLLIQYVYHDGQVGDFARTGLLFLTETASKSKNLEKWMIESDLATIMASGLGALYSRLTRRLPDLEADKKFPPILALSDCILPSSPVAFTTSEFQHDLDAFLSYLKFWQDTLDHCASTEVIETLLDHFQVLFLQQLLYPSLLESSDVDGGSTASVITYLYWILASLENPALVQCTLQYLLGHNRDHLQEGWLSHHRARMSLSRRKSLDHLTALAEAQENLSPALFNLRDLIVMSLKSNLSQTTTATLRLLSIILQKHHIYVRTSLFTPGSILEGAPVWRMSKLNSQLSKLFLLASDIGQDVNLNESYENVANDVSLLLGSHTCLLHPAEDNPRAAPVSGQYSIAQGCALRKEMSELLYSFFANQTPTNLALTESIISLACCRLISQNAWFIPMSPTSDFTVEDTPSICNIIESLVNHVRRWRSSVEDWDALLTAQRRKLSDKKDEESEDVRLASNSSAPVPLEAFDRGRRGRAPRSEIFDSMDESFSSPPTSEIRASPDPIAVSPSSFEVCRRSANSKTWGASNPPSILQRRILLPQLDPVNAEAPIQPDSQTSSKAKNADGDISCGATTVIDQPDDGTASLGHILTNSVILQEFVLEVIAVVQIRASLFEEVDFA